MGNMCGGEETESKPENTDGIKNPGWNAAVGYIRVHKHDAPGMAAMSTVIRAIAIMQKHDPAKHGEKKVFYTSNYADSADDPTAVAVSNAAEVPSDYSGKRDEDLSPTMELLDKYHNRDDDKGHTSYAQDYIALLAERGLTVAAIAEKFESGTTFICYDYDDATGHICHRMILAELLNATGMATVTSKDAPATPGFKTMLTAIRAASNLQKGTYSGPKKVFYTSSYERSGDDPKAVAVSFDAYIPDSYSGTVGSDLAPTKEMLEIYQQPGKNEEDTRHSEYATAYLGALKERELDAASIAQKYEDGTIFICYDYNDADQFQNDSVCHRIILSELLNKANVAMVTPI